MEVSGGQYQAINTASAVNDGSSEYAANRVLQGIFIGNSTIAEDEEFIYCNEIGIIMNCAGSEIKRCFVGNGVKYLTLNWKDDGVSKIFDYKGEVVKKITEYILEAQARETNILIASKNGKSRSVIALAIFLVAEYRWQPRRALQFIATRRIGCNPSPHLVKHLIQWSKDYEARARSEGDTSEPFYKDIFGEMTSEQIKALTSEELLHRRSFQNALNCQDKNKELQLRKPLPDFVRAVYNEGILRPSNVLGTVYRYLTKRHVHWSDGRTSGQVSVVNLESPLFRMSSPDYTSRVTKDSIPGTVSFTAPPRISEGLAISDASGSTKEIYLELFGDQRLFNTSRTILTKNSVPPSFSILLSIPTDGCLSRCENPGEQSEEHVYPSFSVYVRDNEYITAFTKVTKGNKENEKQGASVSTKVTSKQHETSSVAAKNDDKKEKSTVISASGSKYRSSNILSNPTESRVPGTIIDKNLTQSNLTTSSIYSSGIMRQFINSSSGQLSGSIKTTGSQPLCPSTTKGVGESSHSIKTSGISRIPKSTQDKHMRIPTKYRPPTPPRKSESSVVTTSEAKQSIDPNIASSPTINKTQQPAIKSESNTNIDTTSRRLSSSSSSSNSCSSSVISSSTKKPSSTKQFRVYTCIKDPSSKSYSSSLEREKALALDSSSMPSSQSRIPSFSTYNSAGRRTATTTTTRPASASTKIGAKKSVSVSGTTQGPTSTSSRLMSSGRIGANYANVQSSGYGQQRSSRPVSAGPISQSARVSGTVKLYTSTRFGQK